MRRDAFMRQLEYLLQDIPEADKADALLYYRDYLEEAGDQREEAVIEEFGSPERVAAIIRADIMGNLEDGGAFTERGYEDERFRDPNFQVAKRKDLPESPGGEKPHGNEGGGSGKETSRNGYQGGARASFAGGGQAPFREGDRKNGSGESYNHVKKEPWTSGPLKWALWAVLFIMASPFLVAAAGIAFSVITAIVSIVGAIFLTLFSLTACALILCVIFGALGIVFLVGSPLEGLMLLGFSFVSLGCGLIGLVLIVLLIGVFIPFIWRCLVKLVRAFTGRGKEKKAYE